MGKRVLILDSIPFKMFDIKITMITKVGKLDLASEWLNDFPIQNFYIKHFEWNTINLLRLVFPFTPTKFWFLVKISLFFSVDVSEHFVCLFVRLFVCLSVCLSVRLSVCPFKICAYVSA